MISLRLCAMPWLCFAHGEVIFLHSQSLCQNHDGGYRWSPPPFKAGKDSRHVQNQTYFNSIALNSSQHFAMLSSFVATNT